VELSRENIAYIYIMCFRTCVLCGDASVLRVRMVGVNDRMCVVFFWGGGALNRVF
jgi:hypothetical protein